MGTIRRPEKVKLVIGLLFGEDAVYSSVKIKLSKIFGRIDFESEKLDFEHTTYYEREMGPGLKRRFLSFDRLLDQKNIADVKIKTNRLEARCMEGAKRRVNIDPGYLNLSKVVLFSTKDYNHRTYLDKGIYSEVTLFYKDGAFRPWPWTYPDYKSAEYADIFHAIREKYKIQISQDRRRST